MLPPSAGSALGVAVSRPEVYVTAPNTVRESVSWPKSKKLILKEKVKNGAKRILCPQPQGGTMDIWVPEHGNCGNEIKAHVSKLTAAFKQEGHDPLFFYSFLDLHTLMVFCCFVLI